MVRAPVVHDRIGVGERAASGQARDKPRGRPRRVRALLEQLVGLRRKLDRLAFGDLQGRAETVHEVEPEHGGGHAATGDVARAPTAAGEVFGNRGMPCRGGEARLDLGVRDLPERLHRRLSVDALLAASIERGGAGVDEVQKTLGGQAGRRLAGDAADGFRAPVGAQVGEHLGRVGEEVAEQHADAVHGVVLRCDDVGRAAAVPIEGGAEDGLEEIPVGHVVGPLSLALEAGRDGMVSLGLLTEAHLGELRIADHEVAGDEGHLDRDLPLGVEALAGTLGLRAVPILALATVRLHPGECLGELDFVVNPPVDAPDELGHVHRLAAHPEPVLEEVRTDDRSGDAHGRSAHGEVGAAAHGRGGESGADEAQDLLAHVIRDLLVPAVLHVVPVDAERGQALLRVAREDRGEINRARPLRAVEAPHSLGRERVGVHRLGPVAPARRDGERDTDVLAAELLGAGRRFGDAADAGVRDDALDRLSGRVAQGRTNELRRGLCHGHGLGFEGFAHAAEAAVDGRADADFGQVGEDGVHG